MERLAGAAGDKDRGAGHRRRGSLSKPPRHARSPASLLEGVAEINLNKFLQKIIDLLDKPQNAVFELPHDNNFIRTSPIALEQIFLNLLTNAIRYNDKKKGRVQVTFHEDHTYYYFRVTDNGIGINSILTFNVADFQRYPTIAVLEPRLVVAPPPPTP